MIERPAQHFAKWQKCLCPGFLSLAVSTGLLTACAPGAMISGPFAKTEMIDAELRRGVSTKIDVERLLGKPNGMGGALMPPTQTIPGDTWVYYNSQTGAPRISGSRPMKVEVDSRDQIIMVFFSGDIFDGYLWFLHVSTTTGQEK